MLPEIESIAKIEKDCLPAGTSQAVREAIDSQFRGNPFVMRNQQIADIFKEIAGVLEIKGENPFRIRAYERAARNIEAIPEDIEVLIKENKLREIPGIGEDLEQKIKEIVSTGRLRALEELRKDVPAGILEILKVPGIGPRTAKLLYERLGIHDIVMLERMAHAGKIKKLPGMKEKTEENILRGIQLLKKGRDRMDLKTASDEAELFVRQLSKLKEAKEVVPCGSLRRMKETVRDIDILVSSSSPEKIMNVFTALPEVKDVLAKGETKSSVITTDNVQVDVRVLEKDLFGAALLYFTGSKAHNIKLRQLAIKKALKLNEYGIFKGQRRIAGKTEEEMYRTLGLVYIPPELREDRGEIEAALENRLPRLIEQGDIKGDLHIHSKWSDGADDIETIVRRAREMGYEYIAITDHSQGLKIAGGLNKEELKKKRREIEALNKKYKDITILFGAEVDIDSEGRLDYPDDLLKEMDIAIAAIHSGFRQSKEKLTRRLIKACQNRYINIIAHPTGRLWGAREGYDIDMEEVLKTAKETNTALEINSFPQRLDLNDIHSRMAKDAGAMLVINTDAHIAPQLDLIRFGVATARRGWVGRGDVLNTLSCKKLLKVLRP